MNQSSFLKIRSQTKHNLIRLDVLILTLIRADDTTGIVMRDAQVTSLGKDPAWVELPKQVDAVFMESLTRCKHVNIYYICMIIVITM